jgi:MFS family permease
MPLEWVLVALTLIGFGVGTVYPVMTVSIQNAVPEHQVGTATGAMNFFRALASTLAVAVMGAILLGQLGAMPERGIGGELLIEMTRAAGIDMTAVFRWVFITADVFLTLALIAILRLEERPLRGPVAPTARLSGNAPPAPAE